METSIIWIAAVGVTGLMIALNWCAHLHDRIDDLTRRIAVLESEER
jgi:hypothetical protein